MDRTNESRLEKIALLAGGLSLSAGLVLAPVLCYVLKVPQAVMPSLACGIVGAFSGAYAADKTKDVPIGNYQPAH